VPVVTPKTEELIGIFSHEHRAIGEDDSADRWVVGKMRDGQTVVGNAKAGSLCMGEKYRFLGRVQTHDRFGRQFQFSSFTPVEPTDLQAIQRYLQKANGIGPQAAIKIVAEFGELALEKLRLEPASVAKRCSLNVTTVEAASSFFSARKALEAITIEVEGLLANRGFPKSTSQKCIEAWGESAVQVIRDNPYVLRGFAGCGFLLCDRLYESLGLPMGALIRQTHCALYALESDSSGSTWLLESVIRKELDAKIAGATVQVREAIADAIERDMIRERVDGDGRRWYAESAKADAESSWVSDLHVAWHELDDDFGLAGEAKWEQSIRHSRSQTGAHSPNGEQPEVLM